MITTTSVQDMLKHLNEVLGPYDPISEAEAQARRDFKDGLSLQDGMDENSVDADTDTGMAYVVAFKKAREQAKTDTVIKDGELTPFEQQNPTGSDPIADAIKAGKQAAIEGRRLDDLVEDLGINVDTPEGAAFIDAFADERACAATKRRASH